MNKIFRLFKIKIAILAAIFIIFLGVSLFVKQSCASDTSLLTNLNNPNVLIFLDTSGSMMWNEGVNWSGSGTPPSGYDAPESWLSPGFFQAVWAPGSNSMFSKIYNAKMALSQIVTDPSFSNLNFAFASFDQTDATPSGTTDECIYANDASFQNPANALYYPYTGSTGTGTPDETGAYDNGNNPAYPFISHGCSGSSNRTILGQEEYFISYDYSPYISNDFSKSSLVPTTWYVPLTTDGTLNYTNTVPTTINNANNTTDPFFDPAPIAGPAINWLLWTAPIYTGLLDPAGTGTQVSGLKAGGGTPMYSMVENMTTYFTNSLTSDSAAACRRNFSIIVTDGEANDYNSADTPSALYTLYTSVDTTYPIETFIIGFGYSGGVSGPVYIQGMANAGAGISPTANPTGVGFSATVGSSPTTLILPSTAFTTTNGVLVGDTISDNGNESDDCETANNNSGVYANGNDCAVVTGIYPNTDEVLLSNSLSSAFTSGTVTVSGTVYLTFNYNQLINSLTTIFDQIESQSASFTSPVVHQVYGQNANVYYTDFKALNQPLWGEGNIFLFKLNTQGQLIGPNGSAVTSNGQIITSNSYWDNGAGAGGELQTEPPSSRYITTSAFNASTGSNTTVNFNASNTANLESLLGLTSTNYSSVCSGASSESACATDIINFVLNPDSATDNWKLGAIFHADPVLIGPPPYPYSSQSYRAFKTQYAERRQVLVAGANDGMLHGFDAGSWDTTTSAYTDGTGAELFGYIPPNFLDIPGATLTACVPSDTSIMLPKISCWYESSISTPSIYEFVDSTPSVNDVFFGNVFNGTTNSFDASNYPVSSGTPVSSWHTVLMGGERNGGTSYYAAGLTNPANVNSTYPDPLWSFTDATTPPTAGTMGNTWSKPLLSYVCLPNPNYSATAGGTGVCGNNPNPSPSPLVAPQYVKTYAGFMGGGYSSNNSTGQAVYSLYIEPNPVNTGSTASPNYVDEQELWKFDSSNDTNMTYSIPSNISPVLSGDFGLQAFYVGDLGGQMWAFNIPYETPPSFWTGCRVFDSDASTTSPLNIFFPPAITYDTSGNLWLYFGTGDRENLTSVNTTRDNEFIGLNTIGTQGVGECAAAGPYNETNLTNETGTSGIGTIPSTSDGWYIKLSPGEKVVGSPLVYDQVVYFTTYTPSATTNACGYGTAKLYAVYYLNGGGMITTSNDTTTISNGTTTIGNLIVTTSTGAILTQKILSISNNTSGKQSESASGGPGGGVPSAPLIPSGNIPKLKPTSWFELP